MKKKNKKKASFNITYPLVLVIFFILIFSLKAVEKNSKTYNNSKNYSINQTKNEKVEKKEIIFRNFPKGINEDTTLKHNVYYQIYYIKSEDFFLISIIGYPFQNILPLAENDLLNTLGIDKESACKIDVRITTPNFANPEESGKIHKLSFCQ
jgi:hypothetical protein